MSDFISEYQSNLESMIKNQKEITEAMKRLLKQNQKIENQIYTMQVYNQIETCLQQIYTRLLTLENAITFSHLGRLHPSIVDPSHLMVELASIEKDITASKMQMPFAPTLKNIHLLEKSIVVKAYSTSESINFVLEIPLVTKHSYNLLHLYPIPNKHDAILIPQNPYLILGNTEYAYPHEPCATITEDSVICKHVEWHQLQNSQDCIAQLLQHREPHNCTYATAEYNSNIINQIQENTWIAILKQEQIVKTTCGNEVNYQRSNGVVLITIDNQCTVEISGRTLSTHKRFTHVKESIPLPRTQYATARKDSSITMNLEDIPLNNLNDLLRTTKIIQRGEESPAISMKPSWVTLCLYLLIVTIAIGCITYKYRHQRKDEPASPEAMQLHSQEPSQPQQQSSARVSLKGGGVTLA